MAHGALYVVLGLASSTLLLSWVYFQRYAISRPPIGVLNSWDLALMIVLIGLMPYLYLALPHWVLLGLFSALMLSILYMTFEPVFSRRWLVWLLALALVGATIWAAFSAGTSGNRFLLLNNLVISIAIVGIVNLWAQSGMKARDVAILAGLLIIYDFFATAQSSLMHELVTRLASLPFAPQIAWNLDAEHGLAAGLGDLLLAGVFPLVMRKGFGRSAGLVALAAMLIALGLGLSLLALGMLGHIIPAMLLLGPVMILYYLYCRTRLGPERTTRQYLQAERQSRPSPLAGA